MNSRTLKELLPKAKFSSAMLKLIEERPVFGGFIQTEMKAYMGEHADFDAVPRAGIAPGEHVPLSPRKYLAALLMILHKAPLSLDDIGEVVDASRGLVKKWRTEDKFKEAVDQSIVKYCDRLIEQISLIWGKLPATIRTLSEEGYSDSQIVRALSNVLDEIGALSSRTQDVFLSRFLEHRKHQYQKITDNSELDTGAKAQSLTAFCTVSRVIFGQMIKHFENDPETRQKLIIADMAERLQACAQMSEERCFIGRMQEKEHLPEGMAEMLEEIDKQLSKSISSTANPSYIKSW